MAELITTDVLVVGAGIAGTTAAAELARLGVDTTLIGLPSRPGDADYDVLVTNRTWRAMGDGLPRRQIGSFVVRFGRGGTAHWNNVDLVVYCKEDLETAALEAARRAGARYLAGRVRDLGPVRDTPVMVDDATGTVMAVAARHHVLATGYGGLLTLTGREGQPSGLTCARRFTGADVPESAMTVLSAPAMDDAHSTPRSIRVLPAAASPQLTVSVTVVEPRTRIDPSVLMADALTALVELDERYRDLVPAGPLRCGAVGTAFTPEGSAINGRLLIGDAAALVNPFTGEAAENAVRSAMLAADEVHHHLDDPDAAVEGYGRDLARTFVGYGESLREAARHYHLAWRVLADTATNDHAFFAKARKAALLPGGFVALGATRKVRVEPAAATALYPFLAGCSELALAAVRKQWPFVASVVMSYQDSGRQDIRPALLFGAASCADGALPDNRWADVAAATELTMLGMLALTATAASPDATQRGVDWTSASAVLAGDFLLSQAGLLVAGRQPELAAPFADWLAELAALRGACLSGSSADNDPRPFFAALFEFPARIGAQVSGAADRTVAVLREFGRLCGRIFVHVEDYLGLAGEPGRLDTTLQGLLAAKLSALPYLLDSELDAAILLQDDELRRRALVASRDGCLAEHRAATALLAEIGAGTAHRILLEFCSVLAEPVLRDPGETPSVPQRGSQ